MQRIRRATHKHQKLLLVVVIIIIFGLVLSFGFLGSNDIGDTTSEINTKEQIEYLEGVIEDMEPKDGEEIDFETASSMANLYFQLSGYYYQASSESSADDQTNSELYFDKAIVAAEKAIIYYEMQLEKAPDSLNDLGRAQMIYQQATALVYAGDIDAALKLMEQALELVPESYDIAVAYMSMLINYKYDYASAKTYANSYMELVGEDNEYYEQMQQKIDEIEEIEEYIKSIEDSIEDSIATEETN